MKGELAKVAVAAMYFRFVESELGEVIAEAIAAGHSWQAIGDVLGMTGQGALKRFQAR